MKTMISYAQNGEDVMLNRIFGGRATGQYIDIGASHPEHLSVTKHFYDLGWTGINIDPLKNSHILFEANRPRDLNLNVAIDLESGYLDFYEVTDYPELSTFSSEAASQLSKNGHIVKKYPVARITGNDLFKKYIDGPVDFLKIDVEGRESNVIRSIDFTRYRPKVLVIEATIPNSTFPGWTDFDSVFTHQSWESILLGAGYIFAYFDGLNRFYVSAEHKDFLVFFQTGLCSLDNFIPCAQHKRITELEWHCEERLKQIKTLTLMVKESEADREPLKNRILELNAIISNLKNRDGRLRTIAVDLTPVLSGGDNGGAKIFVLELLRRLARLHPEAQFVLLTHFVSHEELASMDRSNVRRIMVMGMPEAAPSSVRKSLATQSFRIKSYIPHRLRLFFGGIRRRLRLMKMSDSQSGLLQRLGVDLLFCPFSSPTYSEPGVPLVSTIYDLQYKTFPEFFSPNDVLHRNQVFSDACRRSNAIAVISNYSRDSAIAHGGLNPGSIRTIYLRMAQRIVPATDQSNKILCKHNLAPQKYLFYPANFWLHKNHEVLIKAFNIACQEGLPKDIKLVFTGASDQRENSLLSFVQSLNLQSRVLFLGYLPDGDLAELMANCAGIVFPSLYEGFGLPVIEAMAAGVPVACSNTTSLPEIAGDAALFFDPSNPTEIARAQLALVGNEQLRAHLIQAGRRRAADFSDSDLMAREYWELFEYALTNEGGLTNSDNFLTGVYADGWAGPVFKVKVASSKNPVSLEIDLAAPEWLPQPKITVHANYCGRPLGPVAEINQGGNAHLSLPLDASGGSYELGVSPTFVPRQLGHKEDERELSIMLDKCVIKFADGGHVKLFPNNLSP